MCPVSLLYYISWKISIPILHFFADFLFLIKLFKTNLQWNEYCSEYMRFDNKNPLARERAKHEIFYMEIICRVS